VINGDAWIAVELGDALRIAVVDGSGHGPMAAQASEIALNALTASGREPLERALQHCHGALRNSRGAAISVVDIGPDKLTFAGVGNVEARLISPGRTDRLVPQRGIAGVTIPTLRPEVRQLGENPWCFFMHSDGISQRLKADWEALTSQEPEDFLANAIDEWGRLTDDATMVLVFAENK
jgi:hypothetical protein